MPSQEEIDHQLRLLATYRKTLAILLEQLARHTAAHVPPAVEHGIREARESIRQAKYNLRDWGVAVADQPNDEEKMLIPDTPTNPASSWPPSQTKLEEKFQTLKREDHSMKTAITIAQMLLRLTGLVQIVMGVLIWTGNLLNLVPLHTLIGLVLVLSLWALALLSARAGVPIGLVALALVWGLITIILGMTQTQLLPGSAHWVIRALHLVVGLVAMGLGETLVGRGKRLRMAAVQQ